MAAVNSVQGGLRLPLATLATPRVLMCSASMGAEGSVTLQLREAVQAPQSSTSLDASLTIGYPDPELLADMLGTLHAASAASTNNNNNNNNSQNNNNNNNNNNIINNSNNPNNNNNNNVSNNINNNNNNSKSNYNETTNSVTSSSMAIIKKPRPKTASPTRHGPQQCQVCNKVFGNASALAKHKLTHSDERKYVCGMCSKAFKRQDHLNGHMLTHRNKKPYECKAEGCGKSYCDARSLRRHTENHHSSLATTPSTPNHQNTSSTGPPTGLSLSPATANGDASSPHGATLIQYPNSTADGSNSKSPSPSSPAGVGNEGLTRQQLDLISQIMQQTKQANANMAAQSGGQRPPPRPRTWNMQAQLQQNQTKVSTNPDSPNNTSASGTIQNTPKVEQKPVECNLCHRKFKNIPALNGHMRLHGGYFKKDSESKKCDKKETPGPPLQTASVGVRALIEEKIISRRSKDLKNSFAVPAPPLAPRRMSDADNFLSPKVPNSSASQLQNVITTSVASGMAVKISQTTTVETAVQIGSSTSVVKNSTGTATTVESKDATLIELLKRGTKVAVKRTCSDPGQITSSLQNTSIPKCNSSMSTPVTPTSTPPLALSLTGNNSTPLALTISQASSGDVFTLAYSTDNSAAAFFGENDVYSVPDTAMLLQAVDTIQLLHDTSPSDQLDDIASLSDYAITNNGSLNDNVTLTQAFTPSRQLQAVLNSPLPESLAEFSTLHSKDYVLYGCTSTDSPTTQSSNSPLPSPLAYPTPPASHEAVAQASPFLDDSHHFSDASSFFDDKRATSFLDETSAQFFKDSKSSSELSDNEKILKLKNELFNESKSVLLESSSFYQNPKTILSDNSLFHTKIDHLQTSNTDSRMEDFNHQNLSFLDEPQNFLDDARNTSSPLSAAFFTATMSSAEEVKEALEEVLPNENLHGEEADDNDIDLYYLPSLSLQSQMMPNSDDPLLSSSPKDFAHKSQTQKFDFTIFSPPSAKKQKINQDENVDNNTYGANKIPLTIHTEQIPKDSEIFLSPNSISSSACSPSKTKQNFIKKKVISDKSRGNHRFNSNLRRYTGHFTPSPILDPQRNSTGLASTLISKNKILDDCLLENKDNQESLLAKAKINIGSEFQATIPTLFRSNVFETKSKYQHDELTWDPTVIKDEKALQRYLDLSKSSAVPLGSHSEEAALKTLLEAQGEIHIAILGLLQAPSTAIHQRWTAQDMEIFLRGLEMWGKDFYRIAQEVTNKTTADCIQLYYFWKKLCLNYKRTHLRQCLINNNHHDHLNHQQQQHHEYHHHHHHHHHHEDSVIINNSNNPSLFDVSTNSDNDDISIGIQHIQTSSHSLNNDIRPHVCEMPDCSASFTSKAALHGHTRIHCFGRNINFSNGGPMLSQSSNSSLPSKDDFPCKLCGKVFNKVKSRSAHMKSHRPQDTETNTT